MRVALLILFMVLGMALGLVFGAQKGYLDGLDYCQRTLEKFDLMPQKSNEEGSVEL